MGDIVGTVAVGWGASWDPLWVGAALGRAVRRTSICLSWKTLLMLALKAEPENMEVMG